MTLDFTRYFALTRTELRIRYCKVATDLANTHEELAMVLSDERRAKVEGFHKSHEQSVAGREREADLHALESTTTVFELRGRVAALQEEVGVLKMLLGDGDAAT